MSTTQKAASRVPASSGLATLGRLAGAVGVVLLVSTPLTWLLTATFGALVWGKLVAAAILLGFYLATNADFFARLAGARSSGLMAVSAAVVAIVLGLVGVLNYVVLENDEELDFTREGLYTLSDKTTGVLGRLQQDVEVLAFYASYEDLQPLVQETLQRYARQSSRFTFQVIDPQTRPDLVERYNITSQGSRIVVRAGDQEGRAKDVSEAELTNAIVKVAEQTQKTIYFLTGHGEPDMTDIETAEGLGVTAEAITAEGYEIAPLSLIRAAGDTDAPVKIVAEGDEARIVAGEGGEKDEPELLQVPTDAAVVIVVAPRSELLPPELEALEAYVTRGGRLLVLLESDSPKGLEALLSQWKIEARDDIVVDTNVMNRLMGLGPAAPMVYPVPEEHTVTKSLVAPAVFATTRSLAVKAGGEAGVDAVPVLETGETAWGETNPQGGAAERDDKDNLGPVPVGIVSSKAVPSTDATALTDEGRIVAFGDSDSITNRYQAVQGNADLFLNTVNWLAEQEEKISIRPRTRASSQLYLSVDQLGRLKFFAMDIVPALVVALGLGITLNRRRR